MQKKTKKIKILLFILLFYKSASLHLYKCNATIWGITSTRRTFVVHNHAIKKFSFLDKLF